jgi:hypothetical protein
MLWRNAMAQFIAVAGLRSICIKRRLAVGKLLLNEEKTFWTWLLEFECIHYGGGGIRTGFGLG